MSWGIKATKSFIVNVIQLRSFDFQSNFFNENTKKEYYRYDKINVPRRWKTHIPTYAPKEDSNQPAQSRVMVSLRCLYQETLHPWLSKRRPASRKHACIVLTPLNPTFI